MITVLVKYRKWINNHPLLEDYTVEKSEIIEVEKLTDLNEMFQNNIIDVKILKES